MNTPCDCPECVERLDDLCLFCRLGYETDLEIAARAEIDDQMMNDATEESA